MISPFSHICLSLAQELGNEKGAALGLTIAMTKYRYGLLVQVLDNMVCI